MIKMSSIHILTGDLNTLATECGLGVVQNERGGFPISYTSFSLPQPVTPSGFFDYQKVLAGFTAPTRLLLCEAGFFSEVL